MKLRKTVVRKNSTFNFKDREFPIEKKENLWKSSTSFDINDKIMYSKLQVL